MRTYKVILQDGRFEYVNADRYRREGDQYVFECEGDSEVQFFDAGAVDGIFLTPPPPSADDSIRVVEDDSRLPGADAGD